MKPLPTEAYGMLTECIQGFERMACAAQHTADNASDEETAERWELIAEIWDEAAALVGVRLSMYMRNQLREFKNEHP